MHAVPTSEHYITTVKVGAGFNARIQWQVYHLGSDGRSPVLDGAPCDKQHEAMELAKRLDDRYGLSVVE